MYQKTTVNGHQEVFNAAKKNTRIQMYAPACPSTIMNTTSTKLTKLTLYMSQEPPKHTNKEKFKKKARKE